MAIDKSPRFSHIVYARFPAGTLKPLFQRLKLARAAQAKAFARFVAYCAH